MTLLIWMTLFCVRAAEAVVRGSRRRGQQPGGDESRSKGSGPIYGASIRTNRMFVAEGGRLAQAFGGEGYMPHPPQTIKFDIQRHVHDAQWCGQNPPDWAPPRQVE